MIEHRDSSFCECYDCAFPSKTSVEACSSSTALLSVAQKAAKDAHRDWGNAIKNGTTGAIRITHRKWREADAALTALKQSLATDNNAMAWQLEKLRRSYSRE